MVPKKIFIAHTTPIKFSIGEIVVHKNGGNYSILGLPDLYRLEESGKPAYAYRKLAHDGSLVGSIWIRAQDVMEDGRFTSLSAIVLGIAKNNILIEPMYVTKPSIGQAIIDTENNDDLLLVTSIPDVESPNFYRAVLVDDSNLGRNISVKEMESKRYVSGEHELQRRMRAEDRKNKTG